MLFDSNGKYIDRKKLWRLDNSEFVRCGTLHDVYKFIFEDNKIETLRHVLLNVGVNDLDTKDPDTTFQELLSIVEEIRRKYPNIKFIISEINPRNDIRDLQVKQFNKLLAEYSKSTVRVRGKSNQDIFVLLIMRIYVTRIGQCSRIISILER